ncbi:interferon-inducible double-stranded RNA-dependent protein kinase activator A homolog [Clupea harengus]|uniref:Interferon-inducible double-stranded RNA-dependent protein kinase activator A homolog n=1 Tax=Clupea harengus TaxID=7950 RepID=A0A6P3W7Z5_CLUHA|nr:interferon-inducible double-stranded RNA-dependent protein kinase activator A homolog [Clupea harengus]
MDTLAAFNIAETPQMACPEKTPIQVLHEYGTRIDCLPIYEMEKAEGSPHQPNFVFTVTIGEITCRGQGFSKKAAKHQASEAALTILELDPGALPVPQRTDNNGLSEPNDQPNPVGVLQELVLQRSWRLPEYVVVMETGPCHNKVFSVTCRLENLMETGTGSSKKMAKKVAAEKILEKLQSLSGSTEITWTPKPTVHLETLRHSTSDKISQLRRTPLSIPNTDYVQMMQDVSEEQGFEIIFHNIDELTVNGQYQCLVQLSTVPVTVCHGTGITCGNAQNDAAHSALQYIKIMATMK